MRKLKIGIPIVGLLLVGVVALIVYLNRDNEPDEAEVDSDAVLAANNRGIGHMERFEYPKAVAEFQKVVEIDPTWADGKVNLAIALLNTQRNENLDRAKLLLNEVLNTESENLRAQFLPGHHRDRTTEPR